MKTVFIIRPFGKKKDASGYEIDFDRVEKELIAPALEKTGLQGGGTQEILHAGNIRADMFSLLAKADFVIADISIHNANVFYELGARHALRRKRTFLIRSEGDKGPFDIATDRYLRYERDNPSSAFAALLEGIEATLASQETDSPIFSLVPQLKSQDWTKLVAVPEGFIDAVTLAKKKKYAGDLELLSLEAGKFEWAIEGWRKIGHSQFEMQSWEGALVTWQAIRKQKEGDVEANLKLGTIFQRLGRLEEAEISLKRVVTDKSISPNDRAEVYALLGSIAKTRWRQSLDNVEREKCQEKSLRSNDLKQAADYYQKGYVEDLNHYYSGINAIALDTVTLKLAETNLDGWMDRFDSDEQAERTLKKLEERRENFIGSVSLAIEREQNQRKKTDSQDRWLELTIADLNLYNGQKSSRLARAYTNALENAEDFYFDSVRRQLKFIQDLQIKAFEGSIQKILASIDQLNPVQTQKEDNHYLLFTGHRIDHPDRKIPRFPASEEKHAAKEIEFAIRSIQQNTHQPLIGLSGGANGGDILFHEVCEKLGIETRLYLALPSEDYIRESVSQPGAPHWIERYRKIEARCKTRILHPNGIPPNWLASQPKGYLWERNNQWVLHNALAHGGKNVTLIALWNGEKGDGPGGTEHMVKEAEARGSKIVILNSLFRAAS